MQRRAHVAMPTVVTLVSWNHVCVFWGSVNIEASTSTRMTGGKGGQMHHHVEFERCGALCATSGDVWGVAGVEVVRSFAEVLDGARAAVAGVDGVRRAALVSGGADVRAEGVVVDGIWGSGEFWRGTLVCTTGSGDPARGRGLEVGGARGARGVEVESPDEGGVFEEGFDGRRGGRDGWGEGWRARERG
jgi:hypothetical protein